MSRIVGALLMGTLLASSVWADVIPSRRPDEGASEARRQVAGRLQELGLSQDRASAHADGLLDREAKYFAEDPVRIQVAGDEQVSGFPLAAFIEGTALLTLSIVGGWYFYTVNN